MPKCSTPDGEETEVQIVSVGRSPRARSRSISHSRPHSRTNSWALSPDLNTDLPIDKSEDGSTAGAGGIVSKVMAMFRSNSNHDEEAGATSSVIVSIKTQREEHIDPAQDPRFDLEQRRWRNLKRASVVGPKEDLETGL
jgi:hypothetical protein